MSTSEAPRAEPILLHHFDDLEQQHGSSLLGMWAFLATEVMFFGGLITAFVVFRVMYPREFAEGSRHLSVLLGGINTVVLLGSSLTMALAVRAAQLGRSREVVRFLIATMALGAGFLGIKAIEYYNDYKEQLVPGLNFTFHGAHPDRQDVPGSGHSGREEREPVAQGGSVLGTNLTDAPGGGREGLLGPGPGTRRLPAGLGDVGHEGQGGPGPSQALVPGRVEMFFVLYFFMTGLHAIHLIIGIVLVGIIAALVGTGWFSGGGETQVEVTGLYWHFIDVVWVFLYPLLYLIEVHR
jgi:cytochrome c oxidase subunit 3